MFFIIFLLSSSLYCSDIDKDIYTKPINTLDFSTNETNGGFKLKYDSNLQTYKNLDDFVINTLQNEYVPLRSKRIVLTYCSIEEVELKIKKYTNLLNNSKRKFKDFYNYFLVISDSNNLLTSEEETLFLRNRKKTTIWSLHLSDTYKSIESLEYTFRLLYLNDDLSTSILYMIRFLKKVIKNMINLKSYKLYRTKQKTRLINQNYSTKKNIIYILRNLPLLNIVGYIRNLLEKEFNPNPFKNSPTYISIKNVESRLEGLYKKADYYCGNLDIMNLLLGKVIYTDK